MSRSILHCFIHLEKLSKQSTRLDLKAYKTKSSHFLTCSTFKVFLQKIKVCKEKLNHEAAYVFHKGIKQENHLTVEF